MSDVNVADQSKHIAGVITGLSVTYQHAGVDTIERASPDDSLAAMEELLSTTETEECFILSTCNRAEWFVVSPTAASGRGILASILPEDVLDEVQWLAHDEALTHLLRVGAGLDSMVLGEDQILGQLRDACADARNVGGLGPLLEETVWKAIHTGERVRSETAINEGVVSLARAAVELANTEITLEDRDVLLVGAGDMGRRAAHALDEVPISSLRIANRTQSTAAALAESLDSDARVVALGDLERAVAQADLIISATNSRSPVLTGSVLQNAGPTFAIDLGQPRDIDQAAAPEYVTIVDLDDLESVTKETHEERSAEAERAEAIVSAERRHLEDRFKRKQADDVIQAMYESAEAMKEREVAEARAILDARDSLTESNADIIESLADALVGQLLAAPTKSLRDAAAEDDWETIQTALSLFNPRFQSGSVEADSTERQREPATTEER